MSQRNVRQGDMRGLNRNADRCNATQRGVISVRKRGALRHWKEGVCQLIALLLSPASPLSRPSLFSPVGPAARR
jgi:hypothetical protein